jgi:hypothetical protein
LLNASLASEVPEMGRRTVIAASYWTTLPGHVPGKRRRRFRAFRSKGNRRSKRFHQKQKSRTAAVGSNCGWQCSTSRPRDNDVHFAWRAALVMSADPQQH